MDTCCRPRPQNAVFRVENGFQLFRTHNRGNMTYQFSRVSIGLFLSRCAILRRLCAPIDQSFCRMVDCKTHFLIQRSTAFSAHRFLACKTDCTLRFSRLPLHPERNEIPRLTCQKTTAVCSNPFSCCLKVRRSFCVLPFSRQSVFNAYPFSHLRSPSFCRTPGKNYKQRKKLNYRLNIQHLCFRRYRLSNAP